MPNNFNYVTDVPDGPDDPSDDQPDMKINTNSIPLLIGVDHVTFGVNKGGIHNQVTFPAVSVAPGLGDGDAVEFVQNFTTPGGFGSKAWPVWKNDAVIGNVQMLGGYPVVIASGVTYLPGGVIFQWGTVTPVVNQTLTAVTFPVAFLNNCFSVVISIKRTNTPTGVDQIYINARSTTAFSYFATTSGIGFASFDFMAIGN